MGTRSITARDLIGALTGSPGTGQQVHVTASLFGGTPFPRHIALVIEEGRKRGNYYECDDRELALLRKGMTPEDLEMEPLTDDECEAVDNSTYWGDWA